MSSLISATKPGHLLLVLMLCVGFSAAQSAKPQTRVRAERGESFVFAIPKPDAVQASLSDLIARLPLSFEANRGQTDSQVKFLSRGNQHTLFLTATEAVLVLTKSDGVGSAKQEPTPRQEAQRPPKTTQAVLRMSLVGGNRHARVTGRDLLPGKANYFIGNDPARWHTNVPTYAKVKYENIYSGID